MYHSPQQRDFARQLRNEPTSAEKRPWQLLRAERLGVKFRRQAAIGSYIVDFVCFSHRLVIELDGPQHVEAKAREYDARRTIWLASQGFRVIRFRNQALDEEIEQVVTEIQRALSDASNSSGNPLPSPPHKGEGAKQERFSSDTPSQSGKEGSGQTREKFN